MGSFTLLLGRTRARRRSATAHLFTRVDRVGRPEVLYVTDSVRKKRLVEQEFIRFRSGAAFPPEVMTLGELMERLILRHGDGRAPWTPRAAGLLAERAVVPVVPWLEALGDPARVGTDLAALHQLWDEAGRPSLPAEHTPVEQALRRLDDALATHPARISTGAAIRGLPARLAAPGPDLGAFLSRWTTVVIDDVLHPSPCRREAVIALVGAWRALGAHVVVGLETGRDLGGAEVSRFFDFGDEDEVAFSLRPFAATRTWRQALFTRLVAEGDGEIVLAGPDGPRELDGSEQQVEPEVADPTDLAGLADTGDLAVTGRLALVEWPDPESEVRGIARAVKEALLSGIEPDRLWVAFPGLPAYAPRVRRVFGELGIPFELSVGSPVLDHPVAALLVSLVGLPAQGWPLQPFFAALGHDLVGLLDESSALAAARACREAGRFRGPLPRDWNEAPAVVDAARILTETLRAFERSCTGAEWSLSVQRLVATLQLVEHADALTDASLRGPALDAVGRCLTVAGELARDVAAVDPGVWEPGRLARLFAEALSIARLPTASHAGAVQVVGMLELRGIHPQHLWMGGLTAEDLPPPGREDYLLDRRGRRILDALEPVDELRFLLSSTIRNAIADDHALTLSWPALRDGNHLARSPLVEDLLAVGIVGPACADAGSPARLKSTIRIVPALSLDDPLGHAELDRRIGAAEAAGEDSVAWRAVLRVDDVADRLTPVRERLREDGFGPWDGVLSQPPPLRPMSVTAFERYLSCPIRDLFGRALGLEPEETWDPDLDAAARGTLLHAILQRAHADFLGAGFRQLAGQAPERLAPILSAAVAAVLAEDEALRPLPPALRAWHHQRWVAGLEDGGPKGVLAAWLEMECSRDAPCVLHQAEQDLPLVPVGPVTLKGRLDRVDLLHGHPVVLDYKTGAPPRPAQVRAGLRVQGPVYLEAMGGLGASGYVTLKRPDGVTQTSWVGTASTLGALGEKGISLDGELGEALRAHRAHAAARLAAGIHHPTLAAPKDAGCTYCPMRTICRVDAARNERIRGLGDDRWVAPREDA